MKKSSRFLSILLAVLMLVSMGTVAASAYTVPDGYAVFETPGLDEAGIQGEVYGLVGDADMNDKINVKDGTAIQKNAADKLEFNSYQIVLADVDFNGKITVKDATIIQKWLSEYYISDAPCWGYIDEERWNGFYGWLFENELISKDLRGVGFTNDYLN